MIPAIAGSAVALVLLAVLEGSCKVPIAGHGILQGGRITLRGLVANLSGSTVIADEISGDGGNVSAARDLGLKLGKQLLDREDSSSTAIEPCRC